MFRYSSFLESLLIDSQLNEIYRNSAGRVGPAMRRWCADCEYLRTVNDPHPGALFCIKHWKQVLLKSACQEFKHAEPFPTTELAPSERKAYREWKQRKIKDYSSLGLQ